MQLKVALTYRSHTLTQYYTGSTGNIWNCGMPPDNELTQVNMGQPFMEFLSIMINKVQLWLCKSSVECWSWEDICYLVSLHLGPWFLLLNFLSCFFSSLPCAIQSLLMNSLLLINADDRDGFVFCVFNGSLLGLKYWELQWGDLLPSNGSVLQGHLPLLSLMNTVRC